MTELVVTVPEAHHRRMTRAAVAAALVVAAVFVAIALLWPTGGGSTGAERFDIPQSVITQAEQETPPSRRARSRRPLDRQRAPRSGA